MEEDERIRCERMKIVTFSAEELIEEWMIRGRSRWRWWRGSNLGHEQQEQQQQQEQLGLARRKKGKVYKDEEFYPGLSHKPGQKGHLLSRVLAMPRTKELVPAGGFRRD